uniref:Proteasome alpha-type subunits domain-containing protein n=1 Tax=Cryptomonas curvata TaxID=233186 RepID=A0A7S0MNQ7_9CRYP|nr:26S proteasome IOTA SU [Cryptomonas curvata]|mmetsp:Transcript_46501/g.97305  ORF Transcript_46501/g.97305 Transcript_46501/m.97305 type:complete len:240 (+) Transcript_46501:13-732(+)
MSRKYDNKTISFCPEGRLRQVEYALESIRNGNSVIGIKTNSGIVLASDKSMSNTLGENNIYSDRIFLIDNHIFCVTTGAGPDAHILINHARLQTQLYKQIYQDLIPVKKLVNVLCDIKQQFTQSGGKRPYGTSFVFGGWDSFFGFQLFRTDPSGNYSGWKAVAIGINSILNQSILNEEAKNCLDIYSAIGTIVKIYSKKISKINLSQYIDLVTLRRDDLNNILYHRFNDEEIDSLYMKV